VLAGDAAIGAALAGYGKPGASVAVALSGGLDSIVLLDAAAAFAPRHPITLSAVHIHHGLSPNADRWAEFCAAQCAARRLPLVLHRVELARGRGRSLEALARGARYERLLAEDVDVIALAHHADDQAETVLLQLLRGAGPHGLAAMPSFRAGRPALLRPLLGLPRAALAACAAARRLAWIEDESNEDRRRAERDPPRRCSALAAHFLVSYLGPRSRRARGARRTRRSCSISWQRWTRGRGGRRRAPECERLAMLPPARARNLLRWFLRAQGLRAPTEANLAEMLRQLLGAAADARTRIVLDGMEIGRHRGRVVAHAPATPEFERIWAGEAEVPLPGGVLAFERSRGAGLAAAKLEQARVALRSRIGGERIRLAANQPTRAVKKLLQEAHMPPWARQSLPLVWCGDELAAVPGLGIALPFQAAPGEAGWTIDWRPTAPRHDAAD
jgi:tRNA(Ile)-lysidine synthase